MALKLTPIELRVLGVLIEKEFATPEYYPLTLSALRSACNQKTSRWPVSSYQEDEVLASVHELIGQSLVRERNPAGGRVAKYAHRLGDRLGLSFGFSRTQLSVLAVLMLRGPQTPGELRPRADRLRNAAMEFNVGEVLEELVAHDRGPWVQQLTKEPGRREARWMHLLGNETPKPARPTTPEATTMLTPSNLTIQVSASERITKLEETVLQLALRLEALEQLKYGEGN